VASWIDNQSIIESFYRNGHVVPVPGHKWDNFFGKEGDNRIQYTLISLLLRHKILAILKNIQTYEGSASRTNILNRGFSISLFAKGLLAVLSILCILLKAWFKWSKENYL